MGGSARAVRRDNRGEIVPVSRPKKVGGDYAGKGGDRRRRMRGDT